MKAKLWNILFLAVLAGGFVAFAYRQQIGNFFSKGQEFDLTKVQLHDMLGYATRIEPGPQGYIVFYSDLKGCSTCLGKIAMIKELSDNYPDIGYYAILKERDNRERFGDMMAEYKYPGDHFNDPDHNLQKQLGLSDHPLLLFFDRKGKQVAAMPLDVDHDQLLRQFYRYAEEL